MLAVSYPLVYLVAAVLAVAWFAFAIHVAIVAHRARSTYRARRRTR